MKCKYVIHINRDHLLTISAFNGEGCGLLFVRQFTTDAVASEKFHRGGGQHTVSVYPHPSSQPGGNRGSRKVRSHTLFHDGVCGGDSISSVCILIPPPNQEAIEAAERYVVIHSAS